MTNGPIRFGLCCIFKEQPIKFRRPTAKYLSQFSKDMSIPLVYDIHHHRCLKDGLSIKEVTHRSATTWNREPLFHISSPINGWQATNIRKHHDFININDFPRFWMSMNLTVEVEAKAKELAVLKLMEELSIDYK